MRAGRRAAVAAVGSTGMKRAAVIIGICMVLAGCSSGGGKATRTTTGNSALDDLAAAADNAPSCTEMYRPGKPATKDLGTKPCLKDGDLQYLGMADHTCTDGTLLRWNDLAWWNYPGTIHADTADKTAPSTITDRCLGD